MDNSVVQRLALEPRAGKGCIASAWRGRSRNNEPKADDLRQKDIGMTKVLALFGPTWPAVYIRKSSEEGLEQEFNSLAAQCEASEAFIRSQRNEGWVLVQTRYDDGGFSGGNLERPAMQDLIADVRAGRIDVGVVYKVDRHRQVGREQAVRTLVGRINGRMTTPRDPDLRRPSLRR